MFRKKMMKWKTKQWTEKQKDEMRNKMLRNKKGIKKQQLYTFMKKTEVTNIGVAWKVKLSHLLINILLNLTQFSMILLKFCCQQYNDLYLFWFDIPWIHFMNPWQINVKIQNPFQWKGIQCYPTWDLKQPNIWNL